MTDMPMGVKEEAGPAKEACPAKEAGPEKEDAPEKEACPAKEAGPATLTTWPNPFEKEGQRPLTPVRRTRKIPYQTSRAWWGWFLPPPKAHVGPVRFCNQAGCRNAVHRRSEWCVDGSCRPCSRKLNPHFYCYGCRTKFSGLPTGRWGHGRQMCCICFDGSPPGGRL